MNKIKRDDTVLITKGRDRGRTGQVRIVMPPGKKSDKFGRPKPGRVIVTGINVVKRHMRPRGPQRPGGIVEREAPIAWSNVALICVSCNQPARVGMRTLQGGGKTRYCKNCDANID
ncbi:MAG TPA: 50S ribosomal protein L24 [Dehalococcoidia bacterium]|nr:50S ribosomal protein L24 [Dehalococcoidia bacterium]